MHPNLVFLLISIGTPIFMILLDAEDDVSSSENSESNYSIPWIGIGLSVIGFALMTFYFVLDPILIGANPLSILLIINFALIWAGGYSLSPMATTPCMLYYGLVLLQSQYSTDTRGFWSKFISPEPESLAITTISFTCVYTILLGCRLSLMKSIVRSSYKNRLRLLLSTASSGIALGYALHFGVQINNTFF